MWRSLFLSTTSLLCFVGCSDDGGGSCGTKGAAEFGLVASNGSDVSMTFGDLSSLVGHDCVDPNAPDGVVAVTVSGPQSGGTGAATFCIPRPDLLEKQPVNLTDIQIVDLKGDANGCTLKINASAPPSGTVTSDGMCNNGAGPQGYALAFNGYVVFTRTCNGTTDSVPAQLSGTVAVTQRQ